MKMTRGGGLWVNLFLWVLPLAGMAVFFGVVLMRKIARPLDPLSNVGTFDVPDSVLIAMIPACVGVPLIVSLLTRRLLGFLAGACLLLLVVSATGWIRSHWATDTARIVRVTGPPPVAVGRETFFRSTDGGIAGGCFVSKDERWVRSLDLLFLTPGREQTLTLETYGWTKGYASDDPIFQTTPAPPKRLGFAAAFNHDLPGRVAEIHIPLALAVPYWFLCLVAVPFPLAWTIRLRRRRRIARRTASGLCKNCGYDLRATPDSTGALLPICPECGAAAKADDPRIHANARE